MRKTTLLVLLGLGVLSVLAVGPAHADSAGQEVGYGAGSVFGTLLYAPFKTSFCVVGAKRGRKWEGRERRERREPIQLRQHRLLRLLLHQRQLHRHRGKGLRRFDAQAVCPRASY